MQEKSSKITSSFSLLITKIHLKIQNPTTKYSSSYLYSEDFYKLLQITLPSCPVTLIIKYSLETREALIQALVILSYESSMTHV